MSEKVPTPPRDIRAIIVFLATQAMIHFGEIPDPLSGEKRLNLDGGHLFLDLLGELQRKTAGNLTATEETFLTDVLTNLTSVAGKHQGH